MLLWLKIFLPQLAIRVTSSVIDNFERKMRGKAQRERERERARAVRSEKRFNLSNDKFKDIKLRYENY